MKYTTKGNIRKIKLGKTGKQKNFLIELDDEGINRWSEKIEFLFTLTRLHAPKEFCLFNIQTLKINNVTYKAIPIIKVLRYTDAPQIGSDGGKLNQIVNREVSLYVDKYIDYLELVENWYSGDDENKSKSTLDIFINNKKIKRVTSSFDGSGGVWGLPPVERIIKIPINKEKFTLKMKLRCNCHYNSSAGVGAGIDYHSILVSKQAIPNNDIELEYLAVEGGKL